MMRKLSIALIIALLAFPSCDDEGVPSVLSGRFAYEAYDSLGTTVAQGWLDLHRGDSSIVTGSWHIDAIGGSADIGPQIGEGTLVGSVDDNKIFIELNPEYRDNNVGLVGTVDGATFKGSWTYIGFAGIINVGTFAAARIPD